MLDYRSGTGKIVRAAKQGLHLGNQDIRIKGLGDEIVRAHVHGHNDIHIIGCGGNEDHRYGGNLADLCAPVVAVHEGQGDIQQHQVRLDTFEVFHDMTEIRDSFGLQAPAGHGRTDRHGNALFILHDQDTIFHSGSPLTARLLDAAGTT